MVRFFSASKKPKVQRFVLSLILIKDNIGFFRCQTLSKPFFQSVKNHEGGQRHINNVKKKLSELQRNAKVSSESKINEKISLINDVSLFYLTRGPSDGLCWYGKGFGTGPLARKALRC